MPFILVLDPINEKRREVNTATQVQLQCRNCFHVLHTFFPELYTTTQMADPDALGETCRPDLGCFEDAPLGASS